MGVDELERQMPSNVAHCCGRLGCKPTFVLVKGIALGAFEATFEPCLATDPGALCGTSTEHQGHFAVNGNAGFAAVANICTYDHANWWYKVSENYNFPEGES